MTRQSIVYAPSCIRILTRQFDSQPIGRPRTTAAKAKPKVSLVARSPTQIADAVPTTKSEAELTAAASDAAARAKSGSAVASTSAAKSRQSSAVAPGFDEAGPSVSSVPAFGSGSLPPVKKKKVAGTFSPELQSEFDMLKKEVKQGTSPLLSPLSLNY